MQSVDELLELTKQAKKTLKDQEEKANHDIYGDFRKEFEDIANENENIVVKSNSNQVEVKDDVDDFNHKLKYEMTEEDYYEQEELMKSSSISNNEELLFPHGPTLSEIDSWKKKYESATIYVAKVLEEMFVFRTINRFEYKQLIRQSNIDASQREEIICETTVLFPYDYNWKVMAKKEGGVPSTLSQIIMQKSGFTDEYYIEKL